MSKQENSPEQLEDFREISGALKIKEIGKVNLSVSEITEIYNYVPRVLARKAIKVAPTNNQYLDNSQKQIFLTETGNSNYWLITTEDNISYLLPKNNLIINTFNLDTVKSLFNCEGSEQLENREFTLTKPAKISLMPNGKEWQLVEKGTINFDPNFPLIKLRSQLEQANQKCQQLTSQLIKKEKERQQLTSQVAQLASEQLQEIHSHLVTKKELDKHLQQIMNQVNDCQQLQLQLSQIKSNTDNQIHHLQTRLEDIEDYLKKIKNFLNHNLSFNSTASSATSDSSSNQLNEQNTNNYSTSKLVQVLVQIYNREPSSLLQGAIEVSETQKSIGDRSLGRSKTVTLETKNRGVYAILKKGSIDYLVPSKYLRITNNNYKTVQALFECRGYQKGYSERFVLLKPATVIPFPDNQQWQLEKSGVLEFELD